MGAEEERNEGGGGGSSSGAEEMAVNGLRDGDHISFSYSSDEDFLPRHMTTPTGDAKPTNKKPYEDEEVKPHNGWPGRDLTSDLEGEREKRRSDSLSLDQRRRRLCSITPRTPLATPTLTTPSATTGTSESSRQPVSPGLPRQSSLSPSHHQRHSSPLSESESKTHSPVPHSKSTHSPMIQSRKPRSPIPQSKKTHSLVPPPSKVHSPDQSPAVEDESGSDSSSDTWQPTGTAQKKKRRMEGKTERGVKKERKRKREVKEGKTKKSHSESPRRPAKMEREMELRESSDEDEQILKQLKRKVEEATEQGRMMSCDVTTEQEKMTSRDVIGWEKTSCDVKREEKMTSHDATQSTRKVLDENKKGKSLEEELAMTSSSGSSESEDEGDGPSEEGRVGVGAKARKRQLLSSSDSDSDSPVNHKKPKSAPQPSHVREKTMPQPSRPAQKISQPEATPTHSSAKKLRLVDIDFTGGRMKLPPSKPQPRHSPSKPRFHTEKPGMGTHRKLAPVPANASNILKSKPLPRPHPPISRPPNDKRGPPSSKDAVLAAKFPQKRKLLDAPPPHKTSKLKHSSFRHL